MQLYRYLESVMPLTLLCSCIYNVSCLSPFHVAVFREFCAFHSFCVAVFRVFHAFHPFMYEYSESLVPFTLCVAVFRVFHAFHPFMYLYSESLVPFTLCVAVFRVFHAFYPLDCSLYRSCIWSG